eukprot:TRINITY_DN6499_c0_g2_i2.p1 TRINITY_DN6499_c0_g2~~TRINITY_DN6499_c0_g2_i2.p1  ORF type:complete len:966 (+),score=335.58 TRINITY_DN6499_c0_g2_i2:243-3140(+)
MEFSHITKEEQIAKLHRMLAPYLLRRLKSDVMRTIPAKSEVIVRVDLSSLQKRYYRAVLTRNFTVINRGVRSGNQASLLNVMMELKKVSNHPYLFSSAEPNTKSADEALRLLISASGKIMLLDRLLDKLHSEGHRVLLFSQMTRMLDILEDYLFYKKWKYERIDGSVIGSERQTRIDRFNHAKSPHFCFLLSTRAGGLGINLATADTVVIFDSDWNPHNDIQALSRAHRIGQQNKVMVYRLVSRGSVEERILQIAKAKMMLDHIVVKKMGKGGETLLEEGELDDILRFGTEELFAEELAAQGEKKEGDANENNNNNAEWTHPLYEMPKSGGIYYDDVAIDRLLDRTADNTDELKDGSRLQNEYLSSFKVANYNKTEDESAPTESSTSKTGGDDYWERLLKDRKQDAHLLDNKSRRAKGKSMSRYLEDIEDEGSNDDENYVPSGHESDMSEYDVPEWTSDSEDAPDDSAEAKLQQRRDQRNRRLITMGEGAETGPKHTLLARGGGDFLVYGFTPQQRQLFHKMIMSYGIGAGGSFAHLQRYPLGVLRTKSPREIATYGALFLSHLAERTTPSADKFADGVPKEGLANPREVLGRIGIMHLIFAKVREIVAVANPVVAALGSSESAPAVSAPASTTPPTQADHEEKALDTALANPLALRTCLTIDDGNVSEIAALWARQSEWSRTHDQALLLGVVKHGYGRWTHIVNDPAMNLLSVLAEELRVKAERKAQVARALPPPGPLDPPGIGNTAVTPAPATATTEAKPDAPVAEGPSATVTISAAATTATPDTQAGKDGVPTTAAPAVAPTPAVDSLRASLDDDSASMDIDDKDMHTEDDPSASQELGPPTATKKLTYFAITGFMKKRMQMLERALSAEHVRRHPTAKAQNGTTPTLPAAPTSSSSSSTTPSSNPSITTPLPALASVPISSLVSPPAPAPAPAPAPVPAPGAPSAMETTPTPAAPSGATSV